MQHEAFHQFAAAHRGTELPAWLNEGLAEYFGEGLFTGDAFVTGAVPAWRLARVKRSLAAGAFQPLPEFLSMTQAEWNEKVTSNETLKAHYDQAWSLAQYLLHAGGGRHREGLVGFVKSLAAGDSIHFDSTTPHRLSNGYDEPCAAIWFVIARSADDRPSGYA